MKLNGYLGKQNNPHCLRNVSFQYYATDLQSLYNIFENRREIVVGAYIPDRARGMFVLLSVNVASWEILVWS